MYEGNFFAFLISSIYFLDSNKIGTSAAAWIALEEIKADAGISFFIISGSHEIDIKKNNLERVFFLSIKLYIKRFCYF